MAGVNLSLIRQEYGIPEGHEPQTAIAIGYPDRSDPVDELAKELHQRETGPRSRKPIAEQLFEGKWGSQADFAPQD